jgi:hypothetical protein
LKRTGKARKTDRVYIDSIKNGHRFERLGWDGLSRKADARVIDLNGDLDALQDGLLDVAIRGGVAVDWAILNIRVEPAAAAPRAAFSTVPINGDEQVGE